MKILFCGLGSIGSRHIKNLASSLEARGVEYEIDALRSSGAPLRDGVAELLSRTYRSFGEVPGGYDIAFVTNPTALHAETIRAAAGKARDLFIEKPIVLDSGTGLSQLGLSDGVYYVACPLRHKSVLKRAKELCESERVFAARAICSSYLPEWRVGADYRKCYSAIKALGGGVELDLIHEWDYLSWLFGAPSGVKLTAGRVSELELDSDDAAAYSAMCGKTLVSLWLDYIGRVSRRELELYTADDVIVADIINETVTHKKAGKTEDLGHSDFYMNEMNYFLDCVRDRIKDNMNTPQNALDVLKAATGEM